MKNIKDLTTEEIKEIVSNSFEFHRVDTMYEEMADLIYSLAANCELALRECPECLDSELEKANFKYLRNILETCANMMMDCDEGFNMNDRFFRVVEENGEEIITQITAKEVSEARNIEYVHVITANDFSGFDDVESITVTDTTVEIQGTKFKRDDIEDLSLYEYR